MKTTTSTTQPWPQISEEMRAHAVSLVVGRYFTTPALLSRLLLERWLFYLAVVIESRVEEEVKKWRESLSEFPTVHEQPQLASIARWKRDYTLPARVGIQPWPQISEETRAYAVSLVIGRYYVTPALLSRFSLEGWVSYLGVVIDIRTTALVAGYKESLAEPAKEGHVLAFELIARWKHDHTLQARFATFMAYVEYIEAMIEGTVPAEPDLLQELSTSRGE